LRVSVVEPAHQNSPAAAGAGSAQKLL
jgi:hypothetical protein